MKRYKDRDIEMLDEKGNYYIHHISALTSEGLHGKSEIAAELAHRDYQIDILKKKVEQAEASVEDIRKHKHLKIKQLELKLEQNVCDECLEYDDDGTPFTGYGWNENRVEGQVPCVCITESGPYQVLQESYDMVMSFINDLREDCEGFAQDCDSGSPSLFTSHQGFYVKYDDVIDACGRGEMYGNDPLELIGCLKNNLEESKTKLKAMDYIDEKLGQHTKEGDSWLIQLAVALGYKEE
jgi:hypothetical protein